MLFYSHNRPLNSLLKSNLVLRFIWLVHLLLPLKLSLSILILVLPIMWLICHKTFSKWHLLRDLTKSPLVMNFPLLLVIYYLFLLLPRISLVPVNFPRIMMCFLSFTLHSVLLYHRFLNLFCLKDLWEEMAFISSLNFLLLCPSAIFLQMFANLTGFVQSPVVSTVTRDSDFQCFIK